MTAIAPSSNVTALPTPARAVPPSGVASFEIPADLLARLRAAVAAGRADATTFSSEHTASERTLAGEWAVLRLGWPPKDDAAGRAELHRIEALRTPDGIAAAKH
ncbi:MAG: hypothetical protein JWN41_984, partial [Thermoleophilia bacterium]|nr:hypothetical protein [Thermoleophilia bacterium]